MLASTFLVAGGTGVHVARHAAAPRRDVRVAVVIDFGIHSGVSPAVFIKCLRVPAGTNGSQVLADLVDASAMSAPTYAPSGLLCSIDRYPQRGCGTASGGGFAYWSYWHGGTSWAYANLGPAEWTVRDDDVEGWRFENAGSASPRDPTPSAPASYSAACAVATNGSAPIPPGGTGTGSSTPVLLGIAGVLVVALGGSSAVRWRRRPKR